MHKNFKNIEKVVFGRGSFANMDSILAPVRSENDQFFLFIVDQYFKGQPLEQQLPLHDKDEVRFIDVDPHEPTTEQIDALYMLKTDPIDYLVVPRVLACALMLPILTLLALLIGMTGGLFISYSLYDINPTVFLKSVQNFLQLWDVFSALIKSLIFGAVIAVIGCSWGLTTTGGAKGVGQSTTTAVVTSLLAVFIVNFFLSWLMFQGTGNANVGEG